MAIGRLLEAQEIVRVVDRYLSRQTVLGTLLALAGLAAVFAVFAVIDEMSDVGRGNYQVADALVYVLLIMPSRIYDLFPTAALLGVLIGCGGLAVRSELVALRASGLSRLRLAMAALIGTGMVLAPVLVLGEWLAPMAAQHAKQMRINKQQRNIALVSRFSAEHGAGFWVRIGHNFIHAGQVLSGAADSAAQLRDLHIYEFSPNGALRGVVAAESAISDGTAWQLNHARITRFSDFGESFQRLPRMRRAHLIDPAILEAVVVKPALLPALTLGRYMRYLAANGLDPRPYETAFWQRIVYPLSAAALVLAGMPFLFGSPRQSGIAQRAFAGAFIGLAFTVINRTVVSFGDVYGVNVLVSVGAPSLLLLLAAAVILRRG